MSRFLATAKLDIQLQARNNLYIVGVGVALGTGIAARYFLGVSTLAALLPGLWLGAIGSTTFLFVAGMILFEKGERTLDAIIVTPLRIPVYLASKTLTLASFAVIESLIVLFVAHGIGGVDFVPLVLGLASLGLMYCLVAIAQVVSEDSVTDFLVPGGIISLTVLQLPFLDAFGFWSHPVLYVIPTQAAVVLMKGGFASLEVWQWAYGIGYAAVSIAIMAWVANRRFMRHIVHEGGAR